MRVIVDEMPETSRQCPYACTYNDDSEVVGCDRDNTWCSDPQVCPFFVGINQVLTEIVNNVLKANEKTQESRGIL